jgi:UPF0755 protein
MLKKLFVLGVLGVALVGTALGYSVYVYRAPTTLLAPKEVLIEKGTGAKALLAQLHAEGLIPSPKLMLLPLYLFKDHTALKAGEYRFEGAMSPQQMLEKIARGEVILRKVTIPEGWNMRQVRALLEAEEALSGALPAEIPEGSVLPNTYHYTRGDTRAGVVAQMQQAMQQTMQKEWPERQANLPFTTIAEALVLASIVERETGIPHERPHVAAVFINRLRLGMPLQADPTVAYGVMQERGLAEYKVTAADIDRDTPWNTYTRGGLPPTPIANPGREAIAAVLNPPDFKALYFVATGDGGHYFAETYAEHQANIRKYRAQLRVQRAQ